MIDSCLQRLSFVGPEVGPRRLPVIGADNRDTELWVEVFVPHEYMVDKDYEGSAVRLKRRTKGKHYARDRVHWEKSASVYVSWPSVTHEEWLEKIIVSAWDAAFDLPRCRKCGAPLYVGRAGVKACSDNCVHELELRTAKNRSRREIKPAPFGTKMVAKQAHHTLCSYQPSDEEDLLADLLLD